MKQALRRPSTTQAVPHWRQRIFAFAQVLATKLERLKLFHDAAIAPSLLEIEISPTAIAAELQGALARINNPAASCGVCSAYNSVLTPQAAGNRTRRELNAADCSGAAGVHALSEPPEEQAPASRDVTVSLAFNRTQYLAGVQSYLLDVELLTRTALPLISSLPALTCCKSGPSRLTTCWRQFGGATTASIWSSPSVSRFWIQ